MPFVKIRKSVGNKGKNEPEDTKKIQQLLNRHTKAGGFKKLDDDGLVGKMTIRAIRGFQKKAMGGKVDGRVDVNNKTIAALNEKPGSGGSGGGGKSGGGIDPKVEKEAAKIVAILAKDLSALPKKEKADLDKVNKLIKMIEKEVKSDKAAAKGGGKGKDKHAAARKEVLAIWEDLKKHRKDMMSKVAEITKVCREPAPSGVTFDKYETLHRIQGRTIVHIMHWYHEITNLEKAAKGLDPKSPIAKGVKDSIKLQRRLWEDVLKASSKDFNKTLLRLVKLKKEKC